MNGSAFNSSPLNARPATAPAIGALRVWHIPQVPGAIFHVGVDTPQEAQRVLKMLADYDDFQFKHRIKPDYCNASGLEVFAAEADAGEGSPGWIEWLDPETDADIDEWVAPA